MDSNPAQMLPRDPSRLTPFTAKKAKIHPGIAKAKEDWHRLHGTKFQQNAGRGFKKKTGASE